MIYEGLNEKTRFIVESILCSGGSIDWDFDEWLARNIYEWEMTLYAKPTLSPCYCPHCNLYDHDASSCSYNNSFMHVPNPSPKYEVHSIVKSSALPYIYDDDEGWIKNENFQENVYELINVHDENKVDMLDIF